MTTAAYGSDEGLWMEGVMLGGLIPVQAVR
jgi:hypothetical protein